MTDRPPKASEIVKGLREEIALRDAMIEVATRRLTKGACDKCLVGISFCSTMPYESCPHTGRAYLEAEARKRMEEKRGS